MKLIRNVHNLRDAHRGCVATIGNFDGVHLGHQQLFRQLGSQASKRNLPSCIISFDPLPHEFFAKSENIQARLTYFREKVHAIACHKPDWLLMLRFNQEMAQLPAEDFIQTILVDGLGIKSLIVGDDFRFGKRRSGGYDTLVKAGCEFGFDVIPTDTYIHCGERVSSTRIREHLAGGELEQAAQLLGRPYSMEGRVVYGKQLGRELGYPTANILLKRHKTPLHGIFVVTVSDKAGHSYSGMASLGERPTVGGKETLLEIHLFDVNINLYGAHLTTVFLHKLRDEKHFASLAELTSAIQQDERNAREWLENTSAQPI